MSSTSCLYCRRFARVQTLRNTLKRFLTPTEFQFLLGTVSAQTIAGFAPIAQEISVDVVLGVADQLHSHIADMHAIAIDKEAL